MMYSTMLFMGSVRWILRYFLLVLPHEDTTQGRI